MRRDRLPTLFCYNPYRVCGRVLADLLGHSQGVDPDEPLREGVESGGAGDVMEIRWAFKYLPAFIFYSDLLERNGGITFGPLVVIK
ncbi:MAG: hypothetical protein ACM319_03805, partial [Deltaproteobacteria bacterium]|nr:hypothetical protein [Candidatus Deferrimicrobiaceae bacterium]